MILDARASLTADHREASTIIIGAGTVGLLLAERLAAARQRVIIVTGLRRRQHAKDFVLASPIFLSLALHGWRRGILGLELMRRTAGVVQRAEHSGLNLACSNSFLMLGKNKVQHG